ncbi:MAG: Ig-like domain-containing protein [Roseburia sp.]|nr:Ig-like domain-containing protein [Roseburia sp.]
MLTSKFKRQLRRAVAACSAVVLVVCSVPGQAKTGTPNVTSMKLTSPTSQTGSQVSATLTMRKGSTFRIKTQLFPSSAKKTSLIYKSNKGKIATVSKKGVIKAKKIGKATITVAPKGTKKIKGVIKVTVKDQLKKVKTIKLNQNALTFSLGTPINSSKLTAKIISPKKPTNKKIRWISENNNVASVNSSGLVTAKGVGTTSVTAIAADGQGAKASCRVTVEQGTTNASNNPAVSDSAAPNVSSSSSPSADTPTSPGTSSSPNLTPPPVTPAVIKSIDIAVPNNRTGVKQGETLQLTAKNADSGETVTDITWSVSSLTGVSISEAGLLSVTSEAPVTLDEPKKINITATLKSKPEITKTVALTVAEDKSVLGDNHIQLNEVTAENPQGLSYRTATDGTFACSTVIDPIRGSVTRVDEAVGFKNDMIAWMTVDPLYAGKTVHISAYMKYDKLETRDTIGLVLNERWGYSNPACKWNADPDTWHYVTGTFDLPEYKDYRYDDTKNNLYLSRFSDLGDDEHPVYYLDHVVFSVEKAKVESVTLSSEDDTDTIYQNHKRQYSAEVAGTKNPIQKVKYELESPVENVSISENGLLTVGKAPAGSVIKIKASSIEDPEKSDTREITILAQSIDTLEVSAENDATEIYQGNKLQFTAEVSSTGEPDESVEWTVSPKVSGVSISKDGLLTVDANATGDTELTITAASVFDPTKKRDYTVTVKENVVNGVTVESAGGKNTISSALPLNLYANVDATGTPSKNVSWSMPDAINGVTISPTGNNCILSIDETVADGTSIKVRATSTFNPSKFGEITITVESSSSGEFDFNKCSVEYWQDFTGLTSSNIITTLEEEGIISWKSTIPDSSIWDNFSSTTAASSGGLLLTDTSLSASKRRTAGMKSFFGANDDYLQFKLDNTESQQDKSYTLSFMLRFTEIAIDSTSYRPTDVSYVLPLKLIALDENNTETVLDSNILIPYLCNTSSSVYNREFYNISTTINVPTGKTIRLQLKLDGDLPLCQSSDRHNDAANEPHPVVYTIDNVALSSGTPSVINLKPDETYQLELDTLASDTVEYYTNCYMSQVSHSDKDTECPNFTTIPANVDSDGLVTAYETGSTALIAEITHEDGTIERKQCLIHVNE